LKLEAFQNEGNDVKQCNNFNIRQVLATKHNIHENKKRVKNMAVYRDGGVNARMGDRYYQKKRRYTQALRKMKQTKEQKIHWHIGKRKRYFALFSK